jgi:hypothetical protein
MLAILIPLIFKLVVPDKALTINLGLSNADAVTDCDIDHDPDRSSGLRNIKTIWYRVLVSCSHAEKGLHAHRARLPSISLYMMQAALQSSDAVVRWRKSLWLCR